MIREASAYIKNKFKKDNGYFLIYGRSVSEWKGESLCATCIPRLVKTTDNHYIAGGIASDAQRYLDRGIKTDNATNLESIAYYMHRPQRSSQGNVPNKPRQPLGISRQLSHSQQTNATTPHSARLVENHNNYWVHRARSCNPELAICKNYAMGRACLHGRNCPYRHPHLARAHVAETGIVASTMNTSFIEEQDFLYGPDNMWWFVPRFTALTITYSTPCSNFRSAEPPSPLKASPSQTQQC